MAGDFGRNARYWAERLLDEGKVHLLATDAHDLKKRPPNLGRGRELAAKRVGDAEAENLVSTRPRGVLCNVPPSELPQPSAPQPSSVVDADTIAVDISGSRDGHDTRWGQLLLAGCVTSSNNAETLAAPQPAAYARKRERHSDAGSRGSHSRSESRVTRSQQAAYRIGAQDVLDISVFQVPDLTKSVQVSDAGTINLPLVGEVPVAGKTAREVERDLTAKLGAKYLQNPQVTVYVKEYNSQQVTVEGAVQKPGVIPLKGRTSLLQLIAMANGFDPNSDWTVLVLRQSNGKKQAAKFDVDAIQKGRADDPLAAIGRRRRRRQLSHQGGLQ